MIFKEDTISKIKDAIKRVMSVYASSDLEFIHTDIYIEADRLLCELNFTNDEDEELYTLSLQELNSDSLEGYYESLEYGLRSILEDMYYESDFSNVKISTPYSFVLIDENKEVFSELLIVDDDTVLLSGGLLKGLDKELDDFFRRLLEY